MSNSSPHRYLIQDIEATSLPESLAIPADCSGVAFVYRLNGTPVGFSMSALPGGHCLGRKEIADRLLKDAAKQILSERIYQELNPPSATAEAPRVEIAICTHNRADALARCLDSLAVLERRSGQSVALMVIDNAPADDRTRQTVACFARKNAGTFAEVRYIVEPKPGLDFARNRALRESTRELLAYIDDDVVVDRGWLTGICEAWAANPDAGAITGPILPLELETKAQIVFEQMGGFGKSFDRVRFARTLPDIPSYPVGAGIFGAGANMVFRRSVLLELGGFDDALDTGAPLPGGGDLDMFYRVARAGFPLIREPKVLVFHQHRREYAALRRQMWTWGLGTMAYLNKIWRNDPEQRSNIRRWMIWWLSYQLSKIFLPRRRRIRGRWPWDMVIAELFGAAVGSLGEYDRSVARIEKLRRQYA